MVTCIRDVFRNLITSPALINQNVALGLSPDYIEHLLSSLRIFLYQQNVKCGKNSTILGAYVWKILFRSKVY